MSWREKSFRVLPALRLGKGNLRSAMGTVTVAWMFGITWMSCISGSQMTTFLRLLGFDNVAFGIYSAIPYAATVGQLYAAVMLERTGQRKYMFIYYACVHRMLWLAIAAIPLFVHPGRGAIAVFLTTYLASCLLANLSTPPWYDWMGSLIPRRIRGRYLANRQLMTVPIQIVVVIFVGLLLDRLTLPVDKDLPVTVANQPYLLPALCIIVAVGAVFGTIDILLFLRLREIASPALARGAGAQAPPGPLGAAARAVIEPVRVVIESFRNRLFVHYALYWALIMFSVSVSDQFYFLNAMEMVGFSKFTTNLMFMVVGGASAMLLIRPWGALLDRWGRRPVMILATMGVVVSPIGWFLMKPGDMTMAYMLATLACLMGGACWGAMSLAQSHILMGFSETEGRSKFIAAAAAVTAVGGFAGGIAGGAIAQALKPYGVSPVGPFQWNNYHATFLVSCLARAASILFLIGMPEPSGKPVGQVVRAVWTNFFSDATTILSWPFRRRRPEAPPPDLARRPRRH